MVFHQADSQAANNALLQSLEGVRGVNVIAPTWFYFNSTSGELENISSKDINPPSVCLDKLSKAAVSTPGSTIYDPNLYTATKAIVIKIRVRKSSILQILDIVFTNLMFLSLSIAFPICLEFYNITTFFSYDSFCFLREGMSLNFQLRSQLSFCKNLNQLF